MMKHARVTQTALNKAAKLAKEHGVRVLVGGFVVEPCANSGQSGDISTRAVDLEARAVSDDEFARRLAEIKGGKRARPIL